MSKSARSDFNSSGPVKTDWFERSYWDWLAGCIILFLALFSIWLITRVGISWDEHYHLKWGAQKWENYVALFSGESTFREFLQLRHSSVHPGLFDLGLQALLRISPLSANETGHFLSYAFGLIGLVAAWLAARRIMGRMGGCLALLLLVCAPRYFGHMCFNPKDIPFAACYMASLYFLIQAIEEFPRPRIRTMLFLGMMTGFSLGVRMAGLLIPLFFGAAAMYYYLVTFPACANRLRSLVGYAWRGLLAGFVAYLVALPFWPALWRSPWSGVSETVGEAQSFGWDGPVLYSGAFETSTQLPWHYLPKWILITLPEWTLVLLLLGLPLALYSLLRRSSRLSDKKALQVGIVALAGLFPVVYVLLTRPTLYDGMRHFLFVLPPLMVVAAGSVVTAAKLLSEWRCSMRWIPFLPVFLTLASCLLVVREYISLSPFYYVYFNGWVGGLPGAYNRYETDYWGLSYREAMEALGAYAHTDLASGLERNYSVCISGAGALAGPFLPEGFRLTRDKANADFYVAYTRVNQHMEGTGKVVAVVGREGVPLNVIWDQRSEK
ncbi:glycosyltransferase family 39 protein [Coraliomargarita parva]|uniref:glycosyltransferase family 39 protein n=1 Tax=Coraliomargarita parva TaxID=3014050 RepID=UPI0022B54882|nr:glycosyltransferase family 39 protein [Coraliomargarita parva]